jgi:hypothetical protein
VDDDAPGLVDWFATHDVHWALQRPDFHLFGTAGTTSGGDELLEHLRRRLGAPSSHVGVA